jgi:hypothetical protein
VPLYVTRQNSRNEKYIQIFAQYRFKPTLFKNICQIADASLGIIPSGGILPDFRGSRYCQRGGEFLTNREDLNGLIGGLDWLGRLFAGG